MMPGNLPYQTFAPGVHPALDPGGDIHQGGLDVGKYFNSPNYPILILILLIFLTFFFLIRGILIFLANPERFHQRRIKKRLREIDGLDSSLDISTLLKKASLEKSLLERIMGNSAC